MIKREYYLGDQKTLVIELANMDMQIIVHAGSAESGKSDVLKKWDPGLIFAEPVEGDVLLSSESRFSGPDNG